MSQVTPPEITEPAPATAAPAPAETTPPTEAPALTHPEPGEATMRVETHGIDYIPSSERHGRARDLFAVWAAPNVNFLAVVIGATLIVMGLNLWQALAAIVLGNVFSIITGIVAASGPAAGTPSEVITRAMYGVRGNRINVAIAGWLISVCYLAINWAAATTVMVGLLGRVGIPSSGWTIAVSAIVIAAVTMAISVYGHGLIMRLYQPLAIVLAVIFAVMAVFVVGGAHWGFAPAKPLGGVELVAMMAAGVALVASAPLSYTNSADFARYLPAATRVRDVALWTTLGMVVPGVLATFVGVLAASAVDMSSPEAGLEKFLPAWFAPIFLISVIIGTIANNAMTAYSSGLALQAVGIRLPRSRTVLLDGTVGVIMTLVALLVWNFLDSVSNALQLSVTVLGPVMGVYLADMLWRRNRYDGVALSDEARGSRFWFSGGVHAAGAVAVLVGILLSLLCSATLVFTGPIAAAMGGIDLSVPVGIVVPFVIYLVMVRSSARSRASL
ncbi:purine-cytosine permease family protein [Microbacterium sp. ASV81]|uniref:Cytosine permease n=1 Tax=Microbacterium capsulatum TaxID=3041921 RepID=A0ABU0XFE3_9MICO|nr:cytosine permease [Microbacterium sp. ASV81]MDQ4213823.1 cytosine permease [Microbacterium sp. ASV81]